MYATNPNTQGELQASPEELAYVTASQCLEDIGATEAGHITLDQFMEWYKHEGHDERAEESDGSLPNGAQRPGRPVPSAPDSSADFGETPSLAHLRLVTGLASMRVEDVLRRFSAASSRNGTVALDVFVSVLISMIPPVSAGGIQPHHARALAERLFQAMDADQNGVLDLYELTTGLSVLCGADTEAEKIESIFAMYDANGDGLVSPQELYSYFNAVFRVLFELEPRLREEAGASPEALSQQLADQFMAECDTNKDGVISLDEFQTWYSTFNRAGMLPPGFAQAGAPSPALKPRSAVGASAQQGGGVTVPVDASVVRVSDVLDLERLTVEAVFEGFQEAMPMYPADTVASLGIPKNLFMEIMREYLSPAGRQNPRTAQAVVSRLFDLFDSDENGRYV